MFFDGKIWFASNGDGEKICLAPKMANRHGLIAGATGTGKTVTLKVLAESFSDMGVPVFVADVKGDFAGIAAPGTLTEDMESRIERFGLADTGFKMQGYPASIFDLFGERGIQLRTTISEMGPVLLARILGLNDLQSDILSIVFKIADDEGLLLTDIKDLKAMLTFVTENAADYEAAYGRITAASTGAMIRALVALENEGGNVFFGEPAFQITDLLRTGPDGKGMINILDSSSLISNGRLYSTFLLWLLSELFEALPEVGDMPSPKLVFFFDEAHLLFRDCSKTLLTKIEQVVKLVRSKGVGVYFCSQNPKDIPDSVLSQLGLRILHGLRAYTPADQKNVKAAANSFRPNPAFSTYDTILALGTGEAVVSVLEENGVPSVCEKASILPPRCSFGALPDAERDMIIKGSLLYSRYANAVDPDSAFEFLQRRGLEIQEALAAEAREKEEALEQARLEKEQAKEAARLEKEQAKEAARLEREKEKEAARVEKEKARAEAKKQAEKDRVKKQVAGTVAGTVGREAGKAFGSSFGKFGKTLGGNVGASLGRGIIGTLFKK